MRKPLAAVVASLALLLLAAPASARRCDGCGAGVWYMPGGSYSADDSYAGLLPRWAMTAFQQALYDRGELSYYAWVAENGQLGPETARAVRHLQARSGLPVSGRIGPETARALFRPFVVWLEAGLGIPGHLLHGVIMAESRFDPGAQGYNDPEDRGILQYNARAYPEISDVDAYAGAIARMEQAAWRMRSAYDWLSAVYGGAIRPGWRWRIASSVHFSPLGVEQWAACVAWTRSFFDTCGLPAARGAAFYHFAVSRLAASFS